MNRIRDVLPPPFDGTTTHCPHALVHLVCLTRKPNLVNLERRETVRRNLKVDLKCMCRTRNLRPGKETINTFFKRGLRKKPYLEVQEPRSTQLPDECMFGMSQRSILEIVQDWIVPKSLQKKKRTHLFPWFKRPRTFDTAYGSDSRSGTRDGTLCPRGAFAEVKFYSDVFHNLHRPRAKGDGETA